MHSLIISTCAEDGVSVKKTIIHKFKNQSDIVEGVTICQACIKLSLRLIL